MSSQSRRGPELNCTKESTVMDDRKAFFLTELKKAKQVTEPDVGLQDLCESTVRDDRIALCLKELKEAKQVTEPEEGLQDLCEEKNPEK